MNKKEKEIYNNYWYMIKKTLESYNINYDKWNQYIEVYRKIKNNSEIESLILEMISDLLSASVYNFYEAEYAKKCEMLIKDKIECLKKLNYHKDEKIKFRK